MKSKNIHILPTDKPSRLIIYSTLLNEFRLLDEPIEDWKHKRHIYITSDEEIKEGEYGICLNLVREGFKSHQAVFKMDAEQRQAMEELGGQKKAEVLKVILTKDQDLIKDGVQSIPDEFLEWFVKNPSCEWVDIETMMECEKCGKEHCDNLQCRGYKDIPYYKIIIPTEEPKQETLEEFAENYLNKFYSNYAFKDLLKPLLIDGAKWQAERMCSEEDLKQAFFDGIRVTAQGYNGEYANGENPKIEEQFNNDYKEWFEKLKKK